MSLTRARYKSFLLEADDHLLAVCRYIERNPLRARLVRRGVAVGERVAPRGRPGGPELLANWPIARPGDWCGFFNRPESAGELEGCAPRCSAGVPSGQAGGSTTWCERLASAPP